MKKFLKESVIAYNFWCLLLVSFVEFLFSILFERHAEIFHSVVHLLKLAAARAG